jgi:hypothetical protein
MGTWFIRAGFMSALALTAVAMAADPAAAGGSFLTPVRDRYEPGDAVTLVGYAGPSGSLGSLEDGPFFAYLRRMDDALQAPTMAPFAPQPTDLKLGQLVVEPTGRADYAAYRASITFGLPADLPVGRYGVAYCDSTCTKGLTDLIGGVIFVGRDPDGPISRRWPLEEPERANLDPGGSTPEPPAASTPVTTASPTTAAKAERASRRASEARPGERGSADWALPVLLVTAALATMGIALLIRKVPKR